MASSPAFLGCVTPDRASIPLSPCGPRVSNGDSHGHLTLSRINWNGKAQVNALTNHRGAKRLLGNRREAANVRRI